MLLLPLPSSPPHVILPQPHNPLKTPIVKIPKCFFSTNSSFSRTRFCVSSYPSLHQYQQQHDDIDDDDDDDDDDEEEHVIGDCLVFEQGIFQDIPYVQDPYNLDDDKPSPKKTKFVKPPQIEPQDLVPDNWKDAQKAHNITKKERRKIAQQLQFGSRLQQKKQLLKPIANDVNLEKEYVAYRDAKLAQLRPVVLDNPTFPPDHIVGDGGDEKKVGTTQRPNGGDEKKVGTQRTNGGRATPKNPRMDVYRGTLDDVSEFLKSGNYDPDAAPHKLDGPRKLFTREEKYLLNRRFPDLECATSGKWQPLHTLAASGEFYLLSALLKHNVDINVPDKTGLTAIHKAILGKKQAIFNILLRESANPFVRDEDGATLMHYAVRTASSQMIKILLLYNVDINLQDNYGWSPLHLAVQSRRTDIVRLLLIKGADKTLKNREGLTPLELCLYSGQDTRTYELIKLIKLLPKQHKLSDRKLNLSV